MEEIAIIICLKKKTKIKRIPKKYQEAKKSRKKIEFFFTKMKPKTLIFD